jgi:hypothetical protein
MKQCKQCGNELYHGEKDICGECLGENKKDIIKIIKLINEGHTKHCAQRQVFGDGECECKPEKE